MPTRSLLTASKSSTDAASYATASVSPPSNEMITALVHNRKASGTADLPSLSGNGLTWEEVGTVLFHSNGARLTLFRAMGASPSAGAVTIDFSGNTQTRCDWIVESHAGVETSGAHGAAAVVQSATNTVSAGTTLAVTLASFGSASNATYGGVAINDNIAISEGSGFTETSDDGSAGPAARLQAQWRADNDTSVDWSWATNANGGAIAIEIKAAGGGIAGAHIASAASPNAGSVSGVGIGGAHVASGAALHPGAAGAVGAQAVGGAHVAAGASVNPGAAGAAGTFTETFHPAGAGSSSTWSIGGSSPPALPYLAVNDPEGAPDDGDGYLAKSDTSGAHTFSITPRAVPDGAIVSGVTFYLRGKRTAAGAASAAVRVVIDGVQYTVKSWAMTTSWGTYSFTLTENPATPGVAFLPEQINGMASAHNLTGIGINATGLTAGEQVQVSQVYGETEYEVAAPGSPAAPAAFAWHYMRHA